MTGRAKGRRRGRGNGMRTEGTRRPGEAANNNLGDPNRQPEAVVGHERGPLGGSHDHHSHHPLPVTEMQQLSLRDDNVPGNGAQGIVPRNNGHGPDAPHPIRPQGAEVPVVQHSLNPQKARNQPLNQGAFVSQRYLPEGFNKVGTSGTEIPIMSNYFALTRHPGLPPLYQYDVSFNPEVELRSKRLNLLRDQENTIGSTWVYDNSKMLFLPRKLENVVTKFSGVMRIRNNPDGEAVQVTLMYTNEVMADSPSFGQILNITMRKFQQRLGMKLIGDNYYYTSSPLQIPQYSLELWPGFKTSILRHEEHYLLGLDVSHKVLRRQTVLDFLYDLFEKEGNNFHDVATRKLLGEIVLTRYNNKTYRIEGIDWDGRPHDTFPTQSGDQITFNEYYARAYDKELTDQDQPLLQAKSKGRHRGPNDVVLLLPELCFLTGISDEMRADFRVMKEVAVYTRVAPRERSKELVRFMHDVNEHPQIASDLQDLGIQFNNSMVQLTGRVLSQEKIVQRQLSHTYDAIKADWSNAIKSCPMHTTVHLSNWVLVCTTRDMNIAGDLYRALERVGRPMDVIVAQPDLQGLTNDHADTYVQMLRSRIQALKPQLVVPILPSYRKDRYDAIKKLCCIESPVPSQVIVSRTLSKKQMLMSVCTKICIQINCKLGGEPWVTNNPPQLDNLMVIGIDVYHDTVSKGRSVGGFVASLNRTQTRYYSRTTFQHSGQELSDGLTVCTVAALKEYQRLNSRLPQLIIVYRDGVGDGQLDAVCEHEVPQMLGSFKSINVGEPYNPQFAVVIVKKRILTRLYARDRHHDTLDSLSNPPPGTVVDTVVTQPQFFDFFLVSQSVRQGTVTPTHYNVIHNTIRGWQAKHFQLLTYKLTHLYYNWPGTIRVPAPCQYAHKLAFLVGQSLHREPSLELASQLFFL